MILLLVHLDSVDDRRCPLNDEVLQSVPLIQVSVHELFHGLTRKTILLTFLVEFGLLGVDI